MEKSKVTIKVDKEIAQINRNLYGHFSEHLGTCIYEGYWVGEDSEIPNTKGIRNDVVEALKKIKPPVLRWPGGCFADDYHWMDGIGPREDRPRRLNRHWDSVDDNSFGTHEFLELCDQLETMPYICGNVGSGTVKEMADWLEYMNCDLDTTLTRMRAENGHPEPYGLIYFGVGNENWGCGGKMSPQYYANEYKRYACFLRSYHSIPLYRIACGASSFDYNWTEKFFASISGKLCECGSSIEMVDGYAFHYYCGTAGTATEYDHERWYTLLMKALAIEELIEEHRKIMDKYDSTRRVGLICDEWGTWHPVLPGTPARWLKQQNTIRDALVAALTLDVFNRNADKIVMANIAQTVNVLQAMVLTDGPKMLTTPTYHVYEMYVPHQDAISLTVDIQTPDVGGYLAIPKVAGSASKSGSKITVSLVNTDAEKEEEIDLKFEGVEGVEPVSWRVLATGDIHDHNTFEEPNKVVPRDKEVSGSVVLPPASVNVLKYKITGKIGRREFFG
ncbi:MAG: alpha-N-arabinofuranosidase [Candidatus Hodarchaeota archaeon]